MQSIDPNDEERQTPKVTRRRFLKAIGATGALFTLGIGCESEQNDDVIEDTGPGGYEPVNVFNCINVLGRGAKGNGKDDDTKAIQQAFMEAFMHGKVLYFPAGAYLVTEPIINLITNPQKKSTFSYLPKICIRGDGMGITSIHYKPKNPNQPLIRIDTYHFTEISNLEITNPQNNKTGIGMKLGNFVDISSPNFSRCLINNVGVSGFKIGIEYSYGWIADFFRLRFSYNSVGLHITYANAVNLFGGMIESNDEGVQIVEGRNMNFFGTCIEGNSVVGVRIKKGDLIHFHNTYFETTKGDELAQIIAGAEEGDAVGKIAIHGGTFYKAPLLFDRVNSVTIQETHDLGLGQIKITDRVEHFHVEPSCFQYGQRLNEANNQLGEAVIFNNPYRKSVAPIYYSNFSDRNFSFPIRSTSNESLDEWGYITVSSRYSENPVVEETIHKITGKRALKAESRQGNTNAVGIVFTLTREFLSRISTSRLSFQVHANTNNAQNYFYMHLEVKYVSFNGSIKSVPIYTSSINDMGVLNGSYYMHVMEIDLDKVKTLSDFRDFFDCSIHMLSKGFSGVNKGTEHLWVDSIAIFDSKYIESPYEYKGQYISPVDYKPKSITTEKIMASEGVYIKSPNGTKFKIKVDDYGVLSAEKV